MKHIARLLVVVMFFSLLTIIPASASDALNDLLRRFSEDEEQSAGSAEEYAGIEALRAAVAEYLDENEYSYSYDEDRDSFSYSMSIDSTMGSCDVRIFMYDDGFRVLTYSSIRPRASDPEQLALTAEYLHRANYGLIVGNFEMDHRDGEVRYKASIQCYDRIPSQQEVRRLVTIGPAMFEEYGDGLVNVVLLGADPAEEIIKIEGED